MRNRVENDQYDQLDAISVKLSCVRIYDELRENCIDYAHRTYSRSPECPQRSDVVMRIIHGRAAA